MGKAMPDNGNVVHEDIEIPQPLNSKRLKIVRQDRRDMSGTDCFLEGSQGRLKILNISSFGILIHSNSPVEGFYGRYAVVLNDVELASYRFRKVRTDELPGGGYNYALEVTGDLINVQHIDAILDAQVIVDQHVEYQSISSKVPDKFARKVYEAKDWLEDLQDKILDLEAKKEDSKQSYEAVLAKVIGSYLNTVMPAQNSAISLILNEVPKEHIKSCFDFFRERLKKLIYQSPFSDRVFHKPLGYAGDYEMMNIIYRSEPEGQNLFAKCLHEYWVQQPAAQAVRNRAEYLSKKIKETYDQNNSSVFEVLSVACGPAKEWQNLSANHTFAKQPLDVSLLDQDLQALKHAQLKVRQANKQENVNFNFVNKAIKNIIGRGLDKKFDLIYSAGLFDYFSDAVARVAARRLYESLKPGGKMIIGNFNVSNPNSIQMGLALDWNLIYRSEEELRDLFHIEGSKLLIEQESLNINLFCIIEKPL